MGILFETPYTFRWRVWKSRKSFSFGSHLIIDSAPCLILRRFRVLFNRPSVVSLYVRSPSNCFFRIFAHGVGLSIVMFWWTVWRAWWGQYCFTVEHKATSHIQKGHFICVICWASLSKSWTKVVFFDNGSAYPQLQFQGCACVGSEGFIRS